MNAHDPRIRVTVVLWPLDTPQGATIASCV